MMLILIVNDTYMYVNDTYMNVNDGCMYVNDAYIKSEWYLNVSE
jgi:hypothetical protein